ncbi:Yip1 family protein [Kistimonas asteriae]|uniref:Yip1 family protein n=1 Tax=Kistimonas asteriae TaxID=517724 RepID=UPI001BACD8BC|nr:Yip1 family protein [Kistimonas asteriae]
MLNHVIGMFYHPHKEWDAIDHEIDRHERFYLSHLFLLAAIPGICSYLGATRVGWSPLGLDPVKLTPFSALLMSALSYCAIVGAIVFMGLFIHWMARTYGCHPSRGRCIIFAAYTATPLYMTGLLALFPSVSLSLFGILMGVSYAVYLLFIGIPHVMHIPFERGFLFASAIVCVGLVVLVSMKVISTLFWEVGFGPVFVDG